jgi:hypothetical protein
MTINGIGSLSVGVLTDVSLLVHDDPSHAMPPSPLGNQLAQPWTRTNRPLIVVRSYLPSRLRARW